MWSVIFIIVAFVIGFWLASHRNAGRPAAVRARRTKQKKQIIGLFASKDRVNNNDVEKLLSVSDATATRILDEMEADGLIIQTGDEGRGVYYTQS